MIQLTRLNQTSFVLNAIYIERIEATPDTIISLLSGKKVHVLESVDEVADKVTHYYRKINLLSGLQESAGSE